MGFDMGNFLQGAVSSVVGAVDTAVETVEKCDPVKGMVDAGCHALGISGSVKDVVEMGAACVTGDVAMGFGGACDLFHGTSRAQFAPLLTPSAVWIPPPAHRVEGWAPTPGNRPSDDGVNVTVNGNGDNVHVDGEGEGVNVRVNGDHDTVNVDGGWEGWSGELNSILNDPGMCLEDKIDALLQDVGHDLDGQIQGTMRQIQQAEQQGPNGSGNNTSLQDLEQKLSTLMHRRDEMFQMRSNMSKDFYDMSMSAINNMKG